MAIFLFQFTWEFDSEAPYSHPSAFYILYFHVAFFYRISLSKKSQSSPPFIITLEIKQRPPDP